ncbi:MAG: hypothetical protein WCW52_11190 [Elusimicrobiales bacterium]|jgi:hypothetical protein
MVKIFNPMPVPTKNAKYLIFSVCALLFFLAAAYADLALRARSAGLEGDKYAAWAGEPGLKKEFLENRFSSRLSALEREAAEGLLSSADLKDKKELLLAEKEFMLGESPAKYAYIWYKTAAGDFSPPETRWTRLARKKAPEALELWKAGLRAEKIEFKDYELK